MNKRLLILIVVLPCILISMKLFCLQMHCLLKHKMLQFVFKCFFTQLLHVSVPLDHHPGAYTCFGPFGPSSGSIYWNLAKVTVSAQHPMHTLQTETFIATAQQQCNEVFLVIF
jgi:hypothetical protein